MMKLKSNILLSLSILLWSCFSSCSWVEYFTIGNLSDKPIYVTYKLNPISEGKSFGIFSPAPKVHRINKNGDFNWGVEVKIYNQDTTWNTIQITLQPKHALILGRLHNDHYESVEQEFINGREFNLDFIEIEVNLEVFHISKETFDKHFTKKNGFIRYDIK